MEHGDGMPLQPETGPAAKLDLSDNGLSRRQFLTYVLGGSGAFMGTLMLAPMVAMALDPLARSGGNTFFPTKWKPSDFNAKLPTHVTFTQHVDDAWNSKDTPNDVYVIVYQQKLMIMSHVCTHLGCHVDGSTKNGKSVAPEYNNGLDWFHCPCHGSLYNIYGVPTDSSPAPRPLDLYSYRLNEKDGTVEVGSKTITRQKNTWDVNPNPAV